MPRVNRAVKSKIKVAKQSILKRHSGKPRSAGRIQNLSGQEITAVRDSGVGRSVDLPRMTTRQRTGNELTLDFFDTKGKVVDVVDLPKEIFGAKINEKLMAQAIRVYLANQRKGTASTKDRGEVSGSTKKIWAQKHTGRARHGSRKAPIFVGGGVVFGPKPRDFSLRLPKRMKRLALFSALSSKVKKGEIKGISSGFESLPPKTKVFATALKSLGISDKYKKIALVLPSVRKEFESLYRASRNIEGITVFNASALNVYTVLSSDLLLFVKDSIKAMEETFLKKEAKSE